MQYCNSSMLVLCIHAFWNRDKLIRKIQDCLFRELQSQGRRVVLCEKEKLLLSGNRPDAIVFSLSIHLENARGIADTHFSVTFDNPTFPTVSKIKFSSTWPGDTKRCRLYLLTNSALVIRV